MKTQPIVPAVVDFSDPAAPMAPAYGDIYHARAGAFAQAQHVFLGGNGLPTRWQGRERFVVLETGFGLGNNFLATWDAWRQDPARSERLVFISVEKHPLRLEDLERAHASTPAPALARQLIDAWPPLTPNLHVLDFEGGRVRLLLALGEAHTWLKQLVASADAFYLDGFSPAKNPDLWDAHTLKLLARLATPQATAATWSTLPAVQDGLAAAGFSVEKVRGFAFKSRMTVARFSPRHTLQVPVGRLPLAAAAREAIVLGAGLAGAACARALAQQGLRVQVLDAAEGAARGASGNPMGLFHGSLHGVDAIHARFNRAAALAMANALPSLSSLQRGLLRLETGLTLAQMQDRLQAQALPPTYAQALGAADASERTGLPLEHPAWFYPGGGALNPAELVEQWLDGIPTCYGQRVAGLRREGELWHLLDGAGGVLAQTPLLVLAAGHESRFLLASHALPIEIERGQLSHVPMPGPRIPLAGSGYAIDDGKGGLWCGATRALGDLDAALRAADHEANLAQWSALSGRFITAPLAGRVAWRLLSPDRLPLVGGLPVPGFEGRGDQPRLIPRLPGLAVCTALASRGITWALLCGEIAASLATGAPCPVEADLLDAVDPARYVVRNIRKFARR